MAALPAARLGKTAHLPKTPVTPGNAPKPAATAPPWMFPGLSGRRAARLPHRSPATGRDPNPVRRRADHLNSRSLHTAADHLSERADCSTTVRLNAAAELPSAIQR